MEIIAVIQARMGSTRLPGKVLESILGKPLIYRIVERLRLVSEISDIVVATSLNQKDDAIEDACKEHSILVYRGDEIDVLDRFYQASLLKKSDAVIRITGDCPLIDPKVISKLISHFKFESFDLDGIACGAGVSNQLNVSKYPDGLDTEIISFNALQVAWAEARDPSDREHVTPFIWKNKERFKVGALYSEKDYGDLRLTVDFPEDLSFIREIYSALYPKNPSFGLDDILKYLAEHPDLATMNASLENKMNYKMFFKK